MSLSQVKALFDGLLPKAVLFDLDGTLVDSVPDLAAAIDLALEDAGLPAAGVDRVRDWVGNGAQVLVQRAVLFAAADLSGDKDKKVLELEALVYQRFLFHYGNLPAEKKASRLYEGVLPLLQWLSENKVKKAVVTNKPSAFTPAILSQFGIDAYFDAVVCGDTLPEKKPSPAPLDFAVAQFCLSVDDCLMVGDSSNDIVAAKACGMKSVSVAWGYNYSQDPAMLGADLHIQSFAELLG